MKILQIITSLNTGGAEKLLLETIPLYNKKGINVDLLLLNGMESPFLLELKKQQCCKIFSLGKGSVYSPLLIFKMIPYLKQYDVVHVHLFPSLYWVALAKLFCFNKIKIIYTEHSTNNKRRGSIISKHIDRFFYKFYKKLITIADEVDFNLKKHLGNSHSKYKLINNGVNIQVINKAIPYFKTAFFDLKDIILIQVSSFREPKDQITVINSLILLPPNVKLLLIGEGSLKTKCENLVDTLKLNKRVKFLGIRTDVPQLLKTADIVVLSSRYEGLSLSSVEGLASGKPFIASNVPGLKEVVKGAGVMFEQGNYQELADRISHLMEDKLYYNEVSKRCIERSKKYDINKMVDNHIKLYEEILDEK